VSGDLKDTCVRPARVPISGIGELAGEGIRNLMAFHLDRSLISDPLETVYAAAEMLMDLDPAPPLTRLFPNVYRELTPAFLNAAWE
jgi:hypothetical protein